jgi:hypothetical protein
VWGFIVATFFYLNRRFTPTPSIPSSVASSVQNISRSPSPIPVPPPRIPSPTFSISSTVNNEEEEYYPAPSTSDEQILHAPHVQLVVTPILEWRLDQISVTAEEAFERFGEHISLLWRDLRVTNTAQDRFLTRYIITQPQQYFLSWIENTYQNIPALIEEANDPERPQYARESLLGRIAFPNNDLAEFLHYNPSPTPSDTSDHQQIREYFESVIQEVHNLVHDEYNNADSSTNEGQN